MIHGEKDEKINLKYAHQNFKNLKTEAKELWIVKDGKHDNLWKTAGKEYLNKTIHFLQKLYLKQK